jgi:hypothetical protein
MSIRHLCEQVILYLRQSIKLIVDSFEQEQIAKQVQETFPNIRIALGDLENNKLLVEEAARADVVIRMQHLCAL